MCFLSNWKKKEDQAWTSTGEWLIKVKNCAPNGFDTLSMDQLKKWFVKIVFESKDKAVDP